MSDKSSRAGRKSRVAVLGRVVDPSGGQPGSLVVIDGADDGRRIACDALGRFKLDLSAGRELTLAVERDGIVVSQTQFGAGVLNGELLIEVPPRPIPQEDPVSVAIGASRPRHLKEGVIDRLRAASARLAIDEPVVADVERMLDELQELSDLALPALSGDPDALGQLRAGLEREIPFDFDLDTRRFKPAPGDFGIDPCRTIPRSPWAVVMAGMMMDAGEGTLWAGRAVSALLRRSEPAVRVARALSGMEAGQVRDDVLRDALDFAADVAARGASPVPVWEVLSDGSHARGRRPGPVTGFRSLGTAEYFGGVFGESFGGRGPGSRLSTLLDPCNIEWLECARTFVTSPPPRTPDPPAVGSVGPTDILAGQPIQIRLAPPAGGSFGGTQHPGWAIELGSDVIVPSSWDLTEIVLDVPALPPGCYGLRWIVDQTQGAEFFNQQSDACARFFGQRPTFRPFLQVPIGQVSVVGQPSVVFFTADRVAGQLNAEGCTAVEIAWSVDRLVCSGSTATWAVEVTDDTGAVLFQGATTSDRVSVTSREDRTYTLTATNTLGGVTSIPAVATLRVERYQRLTAVRKVSPVGLVRAESVVTIEVETSCPADDPAVVALSSDQPNRCPGLTITVPVGQTRATGQVNAGSATGRVTLSGAVAGVNQAPVRETFVVHNPAFDAFIGASLEQCDGGSVTVRVRGAISVSSVGLSGPSGFVPSSGALQVVAAVPSDPASGTLQVTAQFGPLAQGTYTIQAQADGVMLAGGQVTCPLGSPTVTSLAATPNVVAVCRPTSVALSATSRRATELSITRSDGTVVAGPVQGTDPCGSLSVNATVQLTGTMTFRAIAKRGAAPTATTDVTVGETTVMTTTARATLFNNMNGTTTLFIYVVSVKPDGTQSISRLGSITSPSGSISYTPKQCELFELWALRTDDPAEIATSNWKFRSGPILGHPSFVALQASIGGS